MTTELATIAAPPALPTLPALDSALDPVAAGLVEAGRFDPARLQQVDAVAASVSLLDSNTVSTFGAGPQRKLSGFLDQLLAGARTDEVGVAGELVAELAADLKRLDLPAVRREAEGGGNLLANLPVVGKYLSAMRRFRAMHRQVADHLTAIERRAETHLGKLKAGNAAMDRLLDATEANLRELETWVAGGGKALLRLRGEYEAERDRILAEPSERRDPVRVARLRDMAEQLAAFETRLLRMHVAFTRGVLSIPQIRAAQQAGRIEIQNTLDTVLFDLPDLKAAMVRAAALNQISRAGEATAARRKLARELQELGVDALDTAYTAAKRAQGDAAADVEVLSRVTDRMLAVIGRGLQADQENRAKREEAVRQLGEVRARLVDGMRAHIDAAVREG